MASAQSRSGTRGRLPPKRCVLTWTGSSGCSTALNSSEMRNPVVVRLFGVRSRSRFLVSCLFIPPILPRFRVIRIGSKTEQSNDCKYHQPLSMLSSLVQQLDNCRHFFGCLSILGYFQRRL